MPTQVIGTREFRLEIPEGNRVTIVFKLKRKNTGDLIDVSSADSIQLEWEYDSNYGQADVQAPVDADNGHPEADWANGIVAVVISQDDVLERARTVGAALTVTFPAVGAVDGDIRTYAQGIIEVTDRPGYAPPAP